jgi:RNA polymerase sigma-70 factor (ECF subfamily)
MRGITIMSDNTLVTQNLIDRAGQGDDGARRQLLERYRDNIRRMIATRLDRRLAQRVDASDIVQETLADAAGKLDGYFRERPLPFFGWLRQIASEHIRHAYRRHMFAQRRSVMRESAPPEINDESAIQLGRMLTSHDTSPSNRLVREEQTEQVLAALAELPATDREVLVMRYLEQVETADIADALAITEGAVRLRLLRALERIRHRLDAAT